MKGSINIIGSYAEDTVIAKDGQEKKRTGGPAYWIERSLKELGADYRVFSGATSAKTRIIILADAESGEIVRPPDTIIIPKTVDGELTIISTLLDEFPLTEAQKISTPIVLDVQGYVRRAKMDHTQHVVFPEALNNKIDILKATKEEAQYLDPTFLHDQKQHRMYIETHGSKGVDYFSTGSRTHVKPKKRVETDDAIGAGDTLLAHVSYWYAKKVPMSESVQKGLQAVVDFLSNS